MNVNTHYENHNLPLSLAYHLMQYVLERGGQRPGKTMWNSSPRTDQEIRVIFNIKRHDHINQVKFPNINKKFMWS
jgi:hypothetical protein